MGELFQYCFGYKDSTGLKHMEYEKGERGGRVKERSERTNGEEERKRERKGKG